VDGGCQGSGIRGYNDRLSRTPLLAGLALGSVAPQERRGKWNQKSEWQRWQKSTPVGVAMLVPGFVMHTTATMLAPHLHLKKKRKC
jgi:hypothetical protein